MKRIEDVQEVDFQENDYFVFHIIFIVATNLFTNGDKRSDDGEEAQNVVLVDINGPNRTNMVCVCI